MENEKDTGRQKKRQKACSFNVKVRPGALTPEIALPLGHLQMYAPFHTI
jgi:hypothetical protein